jgi:hypothetical protein
MRTLLAIACLAALGGCAIVVAPGAAATTRSGRRSAARRSTATASPHATSAMWHRERPGRQRFDVVDVRVGPAPSLVVEADSNLLPLIRTEVRGDTLYIYAERSYRSRNPVHVIYTVPRLSDLRQNGSGRV